MSDNYANFLIFVIMWCLLWTANKALEVKMEELEECKNKEIAELKEIIRSQEKELDNANELLSDAKHRG